MPISPTTNLIFVINSGSSSLKFGVYSQGPTDELPLLAGSADGIGHDNGSLYIRSSSGESLLHSECVHESQANALTTVAKAMSTRLSA